MSKFSDNEYAIRVSNRYCGGLLLISLIFLQDFTTMSKLDWAAFFSVLAFSLALPPLGATLVVNIVESKYRYGFPHATIVKAVHGLFVFGVLAALIGVITALWHIFWAAGMLFLAMLVLVTVVYGLYILDRDEGKKKR